eukprot:CAMPEP_0198212032 /NCGR_PEP_ID=MMETSP1445-20131203/25485_1 /TAXON_ID=36898 /ORGANISM="Pyramimonas sp., Strain CCMP2087" /LENGTH=44 /DNA_ID= /DNA_START= /DNA_END= /DNA_ORIENTATION=
MTDMLSSAVDEDECEVEQMIIQSTALFLKDAVEAADADIPSVVL